MVRKLLLAVMALTVPVGAGVTVYELLPATRARAWNERGIRLAAAGSYENAIHAYAVAVKINPDYSAAHYNMGRSYLALRHTDQAAACFRRALDEDPGNVEASRLLTLTSVATRSYR